MQIKDSIVAREAMMTSIINHFGEVAPMVEHNVFSWMNFLSEDYDGGMWDYHELSNGGFYMTPPAEMYKVHQKRKYVLRSHICAARWYNRNLFFSILSFASRLRRR